MAARHPPRHDAGALRPGHREHPRSDAARDPVQARRDRPEDGSAGRVDISETTPAVEGIEDTIRALSLQNDVQPALQSRALQIAGDLMHTRSLMFGQQAGNAIQTPLLVVLVFWLAALFASFGLFAPRNVTVIAVLCVSALSVSDAIRLILEMNQPFQGW